MGGEQSSLIRTALPSAGRRHKLSLSVLFVRLDVGGGDGGGGGGESGCDWMLSIVYSFSQ